MAYQKVGRYEESIAEFTAVIGSSPNLIEAYIGRGIVYSLMGDLKKARKDYSTIFHMYPRCSTALNNMAYRMAPLTRDSIVDREQVILGLRHRLDADSMLQRNVEIR